MFWHNRDSNQTTESIPDDSSPRLKTQFLYYDRNSKRHFRRLGSYKVIQILAGVAIPVIALAVPDTMNPKIIMACLGALISSIESFVQFQQYQHNWVRWRWAAESLRREAYLYKSGAGRYRKEFLHDVAPEVVLAENIEDIVAEEQQTWRSLQVRIETEQKKPEVGEHNNLAKPGET